jgi:hypothetical protein
MFRATMGPSPEDKLCLCDTLYLLFCVDDCLVCPKHVEIDRYTYTKKNCAPSWCYLQGNRNQQYAFSVFELKYLLTYDRPAIIM